MLGPKEADNRDEEPYIYYVKVIAADLVEEYHVEDLKQMLQTSGTAYYEDADALH